MELVKGKSKEYQALRDHKWGFPRWYSSSMAIGEQLG